MTEDPSKRLDKPSLRGAHLLPDPHLRPPEPTRRHRVAAFLKRGRILIAALLSVLIMVVGLLNASFDLWGKISGSGAGAGPTDEPTRQLDVGLRTVGPQRPAPGEVALWDDSQTACRDANLKPPVLTREPTEWDELRPGDGDVGTDHEDWPILAASWVHDEVVDTDPDDFSLDEFISLGARSIGPREIRVLMSNRTDEQLVVTNMTLQVERRQVPGGTIMYSFAGGAEEYTAIIFDLREEDPVARAIDDDCKPSGPFFDDYALVIDPGKAEIVAVEVHSAECHCLVRVDLEYWHQGQWHTLAVPETGHDPISVIGTNPEGYDMVYMNHGRHMGDPANPEIIEKFDCRRTDHSYCTGTFVDDPRADGDPGP